tara:strand:+ start:455 stop:730 length:276 start_codon:yes stop_codon:yes gene_type:complete
MTLETTVFTFNISVSYDQWVAGFDSQEISKMHDEHGIKPLFRGVNSNDHKNVIVIHQAEEGVARAFFEANREPIEASGHIWDSTEITSWKS